MQLLLLISKDDQLILVDKSSCDYVDGVFIPRDEHMKSIVKSIDVSNEEAAAAASPAYDPNIVGATFTSCAFVKSTKFMNEVIINTGNNFKGENVHLSLLVDKFRFKDFTKKGLDIDGNPYFIVDDYHYVNSGKTEGRTVKEIFCNLKSSITKLKPNINKEMRGVRFNFVNENDTIFDTILVLPELVSVSPTGLGRMALK